MFQGDGCIDLIHFIWRRSWRRWWRWRWRRIWGALMVPIHLIVLQMAFSPTFLHMPTVEIEIATLITKVIATWRVPTEIIAEPLA